MFHVHVHVHALALAPCTCLVPARYERLHSGELPKGSKKNRNWDKLNAMKNVLHKVMVAKQEHFFLECTANPFGLTCRGCPTFSHDGMCPHVMAVTHVMEQEKDEGDRDDSLDLYKAMATLDRAGGEGVWQTEEGGGGMTKKKARRNRKRWPRRGGRAGGADGLQNVVAKGKGVKKKKGVVKKKEGKGKRGAGGVAQPIGTPIGTPAPACLGGRSKAGGGAGVGDGLTPSSTPHTVQPTMASSPYEPPPAIDGAAQGHKGGHKATGGGGSATKEVKECHVGTGVVAKGTGGRVGAGRVGAGKPATVGITKPATTARRSTTQTTRKQPNRRNTAFSDIHRGAVGSAWVENIKALSYDDAEGDHSLISGVARFLDMWQTDQDAGMVAEDGGENNWSSLATCPPLVATGRK